MKLRMSLALFRVLAASAIAMILAISAFAQTETTIYSFTVENGGFPYSQLAIDNKGNLYGTTESGGTAGLVFELSRTSNSSWAETVLHLFSFGGTDGALPTGGVTIDSKGNLYGTTSLGGTNQLGVIYELTPEADGTWSEQILHTFTGTDGANSYASSQGLILDSAGNLYGTTQNGGTINLGVVFRLAPSADGTWTETVLHNFMGSSDGRNPYARLTTDAEGNIYGVAQGGPKDYGMLYELVRGPAGSWTEKNIYTFTGVGGLVAPASALAVDRSGNLYAAESFALYKFAPSSNGTWTVTNLHQFTGGSDGAVAQSGLIFDKSGNIYGTTTYGGLHLGTVYELTPNADGSWSERILHSFRGNDGELPDYGALILDQNGHLYGATFNGGTFQEGAAFEITP